MTKYLTDIEREKIRAFNGDTILKNAVRKVMLEPLHKQGVINATDEYDPTINFALTPAFNMLMQKREMWDIEKLGLFTMSNAMAIQMVEQGFGNLENVNDEVEVLVEDEVSPQ